MRIERLKEYKSALSKKDNDAIAEFTSEMKPFVDKILDFLKDSNLNDMADFVSSPSIFKEDGRFYKIEFMSGNVVLYYGNNGNAATIVMPEEAFVSDNERLCINSCVYKLFSEERKKEFEMLEKTFTEIHKHETRIRNLIESERNILEQLDK